MNLGDSIPKVSIEEYHIAHNWGGYEDFRLKKKTGLQTGFPTIDSKLFYIPGVTALVGKTGLGKSYFTMNIYMNLAQKGIPVILLDKENGFSLTRTRMLCFLSGLTDSAINSGKFINDEESRYFDAVNRLSQLPIYYFDDMKPEEVEPFISSVGAKHKKRVFFVADSINRLIKKFDDRRGEIDSWGTLFNNLKLKYDNFVNFWLICEENNEGEIKESTTIGHLAELWLRIAGCKEAEKFILECKKNRNGPKGIITSMTYKRPFCYQLQTIDYLPE